MNSLGRQLSDEIHRAGPISFAEFMQRALYDPAYGYYNSPARQLGKRGDFFTNVSVGSFFGELLAFQFTRWIQELSRQEENFKRSRFFSCVEAGSHDGQLAFDILDALQDSDSQLFASFQYWIVEPSLMRRTVQQKTLSRFTNVRWFKSPTEISGLVNGVFFSNELLDAMPVHVLRWNAAAHIWNEMGVGISAGNFVWTPLSSQIAVTPQLPDDLLAVLPDGYTMERPSRAARQWWSEAASALARGKLLTIDYGGAFEELISPARPLGTLRAYSQHRLCPDLLADPGEQDITAHVDFSEFQSIGALAGLRTETFTTQSQFLTSIAREFWLHRGSWPQQQVRQFQTLTHPEHLGRSFRVLVQSR